MGVASTFAMLAALFFWFPKMFGRALSEPLGKIHFWLTFVGVYLLFVPMHWLGLVSRLAHPEGEAAAAFLVGMLQTCITLATVITIAAQGVFVLNVAVTLLRTAEARDTNPWRAASLEWSTGNTLRPSDVDAGGITVHRGAYEFASADRRDGMADFLPQDARGNI
jgi:cytochrome c oxidase subunit 1